MNYIEILKGLFYEVSSGLPFRLKNGKYHQITTTRNGYFSVSIKRRHHPWHRIVYKHFYGDIPPNTHIDHIDNKRTNNLYTNLRAISVAESCAKHRVSRIPKSGRIGVYYSKSRRKYLVKIQHHNIMHYIGVYDNATVAQRSYMEAKKRLAGDIVAQPYLESIYLYNSINN